jgi:hypothetical protein
VTKATKTVNPLHFEDLEPHRFEDLVRQLVYDFRQWRRLEATGRLGSEQGFDIRGWETTPIAAEELEENDEAEETDAAPPADRLWLFQCKREKSISPKQLKGYLDEIRIDPAVPLYGAVFVAACDFSKKARDAFREWCIGHNISEHQIWGKAELEDMLFQPKYDHLLFAYFGISLQIRKRSLKTALRARLAIKRQALKYLGPFDNFMHRPVLLRDPDATEYPSKDQIKDFDKNPKWMVCYFAGHYPFGLIFRYREHFAYLADDKRRFDYEKRVNLLSDHPEDPWTTFDDEYYALRMKVAHYCRTLSKANEGRLEIDGFIAYDDILAIDERGDVVFEHPHVYVRFSGGTPFSAGIIGTIYTYYPERKAYRVLLEDQVKFFPESYPDIEKEPPTSTEQTPQ